MNLFIKIITIISIFLINKVINSQVQQLEIGQNSAINCDLVQGDVRVNDVEWYAKVSYDNKVISCPLCPTKTENCKIPLNSITYDCKGNVLSLYKITKDYPAEFTCGYHDDERTYKVEYIRSNVTTVNKSLNNNNNNKKRHNNRNNRNNSRHNSFVYKRDTFQFGSPIGLKYLTVSFQGDTYAPSEGVNVLTVKENREVNVTCEIRESSPPANITLTIDNKRYKEIKMDFNKMNGDIIKKNSYTIKFDRSMQSKKLTCAAKVGGETAYFDKLEGFVANLNSTYKIDVQFRPSCQEKHYNVGFNRTVSMECNVLSANPPVIQYTFDAPNKNRDLDPKQVNNNRITVTPRNLDDMGAYACIVKNIAGTNSCSLNLKLGDYPDPPYDCKINYFHESNKTRAKINCKVGFNQGGDRADFYVYERMKDGLLKFAGSVNLMDSLKTMNNVDYLTREIDDYSYYEFVVMQNNNYGNSSQVDLEIGVKEEKATGMKIDKNTVIIVVCSIVGGIIFLCICCCCCTNACSSNQNSRFFKCCSCCADETMDDIKANDRNASTYVSHRDDYLNTYKEDEIKQEIKYIPTDNGLVYTPMLKSGSLNKENDDVINVKNVVDNQNRSSSSSTDHHRSIYTYNDNNLTSSFRAELNQKLKQQRDELETKLNNKSNNIELQTPASSYETTSSSSCTSNIDLMLNNPIASKQQLLKPAILKPKPRRTIVNNNSKQLQSPSTSITDLSSINCTPQHFNNDDNYALIHTAKSTYATIQRPPRQRPPDGPPPPPLSTKISATTTFNRYVLTTTTNMDDSNTINTSSNDETMLIKRQQHNYIQKSDC